MKKDLIRVANNNLNVNQKSTGSLKTSLSGFLVIVILLLSANNVSAHCDTMDGPLIKDARIALEKNNVNYVLKWVQAENEAEVKEVFNLAVKVRKTGHEANVLADKYFFETLVRLHRIGEGVPYTGIKPSGSLVEEKILAADKSIEAGNLSPLKDKVSKEMFPELAERFHKVMSLKNYDVNNLEAGREYIEAYVQFFKFAEGEEAAHHTVHEKVPSHSDHNH